MDPNGPQAGRPAGEPIVAGRGLTALLSQVEHQLSAQVESALGPDGPTLDQWRVLSLLTDGAGHPMSEIAAHAMVPAPTLTKIVDRLVDGALVYRRADDIDRRRVLVFLSEHGRAVHGRLAPLVDGVDDALSGLLGPRDAALLGAILRRLRAPDAAGSTVAGRRPSRDLPA